MTKKTYTPEGAVIVGPYSPAVDAGELIFFSGQIPIDSNTGRIVKGGIKEQTEQCLKNLSSVLAAAGVGTDDVIKTTIYLTDMNDYATVNEIYGNYFKAPYPARTAIAVCALPIGAKVEIEVIVKK